MNDITLTDFQTMLDNALRPISENLTRVNDNLIKLETQQKETSEDIHKSVIETELVKLQVQHIEEAQNKAEATHQKDIDEFKKSLTKNWDKTRELDTKYKVIAGLAVSAFGAYEIVKGLL